jgi:hypothetical protein
MKHIEKLAKIFDEQDINLVVVNLVAEAKSGKSVLASNLKEYINSNTVRHSEKMAYADAVKDDLARMLDLPIEYFYTEPYKTELRPMMQVYATNVRRNPILNGSPTYWTDYLLQELVESLKASVGELPATKDERTVILIADDVRFQTELDCFITDNPRIKVCNVRVIPINSEVIEANEHISETGVKNLDLTTGDVHTEIIIDHSKGVDSDEYKEQVSNLWLDHINPLTH